jgi:hypothetical protein
VVSTEVAESNDYYVDKNALNRTTTTANTNAGSTIITDEDEPTY